MGGTMKNKIWTQAERDKCIELAKEGWSSTSIGARIGRKRNSVIGFLFRSGVPLMGNKNLPPKVTTKKERVGPRARVKPFNPVITHPQPEPELTSSIKQPVKSGYGYTKFVDGRFDQCQWIVQTATVDKPTMICGDPVKNFGCRWCKDHYRIVYVPRTDQKKLVPIAEFNWKKEK